jgi:hypothetical protein
LLKYKNGLTGILDSVKLAAEQGSLTESWPALSSLANLNNSNVRLSRGLSGGDIFNICLNAIHAGSMDAEPAKWRVTQEMLERAIEKVRVAMPP